MKIVLPKTLAEPLTIPWPKPFNDSAVYIANELESFFRYLDEKGITPVPLGDNDPDNTTWSRVDVGRMLRKNALHNGAATSWIGITNFRGGVNHDMIGYRYEVSFTLVPGGSPFRIILNSSFK